jgi:hypothetical protein
VANSKVHDLKYRSIAASSPVVAQNLAGIHSLRMLSQVGERLAMGVLLTCYGGKTGK